MKRSLHLLTVTLLLSAAVWAATLAGVTLADTIDVGGHKLLLNGLALRKKFIFKVYVAGLYLPARQNSPGVILAADEPRVMVMHFLRSVEAKKINEAWLDGLQSNTPHAPAELKKQFALLTSWMENVNEGDQLQFKYTPQQGCEVLVKGRSKGTIPGKAFADALLGCWIGPDPGPGEGFKSNLLGVR